MCGRAYLGKGDLKSAVIALTNVQTLEPGRTDNDEAENPDKVLDEAKQRLEQAASAEAR